MKASYRWIRALVPGLDASPHDLAERFTRAGLEVEAVHPFGQGLEPIVVAAVRHVEPHPTRAALRLVTVDCGGGREMRVVCGAPNVPPPGGLVALAPLGTHLPAKGLTLTARDIGGIVSEGMLCSESEMGLGDDHDGILVLPAGTATPGTPLVTAVPAVQDSIFEIGVTPNRPDALGHIGLAREAAALYGLPWAAPSPEAPGRVAQGTIGDLARVVVDDFERCPHYGAAAVVDVTIAKSPAWLRYRLTSLGVRPISNVVDVTNLVLLEFGHPMHAFDLDKVRGGRIEVRRARAGERLLTLDGVDRALDADDLVICDGEGPVALAGVMGGGTSEIGEGTRRVLLECAYFAPRGVRRSARRHGLHTESSHRFERGVDRGDAPDVLAHAAALVTGLAGGSAVPGTLHVFDAAPVEATTRLRGARLDALLGVHVDFDEALALLGRLGFRARVTAPGEAEVSIPLHRPDCAREVDLIEEVARVRGLDAIPTVLPAIAPQPPRPTGVTERRVREAAVALGLSEALLYGFVSPRDLAAVFAPPPAVRVLNPLTEERSVMRTSLLPGLLEALVRAVRRGEPGARLFATGARFLASGGELPDERPSFAAVLAGPRAGWLQKPADVDVWDAKAVALEVVERVTGRKATVAAQAPDARSAHLHPRGAGEITVGGMAVGTFGLLHPDVLEAWDLGGRPVVVVELDLGALDALGRATPRFAPIPRLPAVTRDIALVLPDEISAGDVARAIAEAAGDLCESVELFDLFRGSALPAGHRSLAYHVVYRDPRAATAPDEARTLTDVEVDRRHEAVVAATRQKLGATLRA